jgi:subtilisin family serine protease
MPFDEADYRMLVQQADQQKFVSVMVGLDVDASLPNFAERPAQTRSLINRAEKALLKELGNDVVDSAISSTGMGQVGLYVNRKGLEKLLKSDNVRRVMPDPGRSEIYEDREQLSRMHDAVQRNGTVAVSVLLHADDLVLPKDIRSKATFKAGADAGHQGRVNAFLDSLPVDGIKNAAAAKGLAKALVLGTNVTPEIDLVVDQKGLLHLLGRKEIRGLRLTAEERAIPAATLDPKAITTASKDGEARVILTLRRLTGYSPDRGRMSKKAWAAQADSLQESLEEIVGALDAKALRRMKTFEGIGAAVVTLPFKALSELYASPDPRIESVKLDDVVASPLLSYSTNAISEGGINVKRLWDYNGIRGAGQWIAIFDTGVERDHPFLSGKYVGEACYGTNDSTYASLCPGQDSSGASIPGTYGAAAPCGGQALNSNYNCGHGTGVAGVAGGRGGPAGLSGVAPDADFFFVNVFSNNKVNQRLQNTESDLLRGLQLIANLNAHWPGKITVNLSLGAGEYTSACDGRFPALTQQVAILKSMNIPVVASSGNGDIYGNGRRNKIWFPACVSNVIKAAASDKISGALWSSSDTASPAIFGMSNATGPLFVAPGVSIQTSNLGGRYYFYSGTSYAAPHVAGVYALVKSVLPAASVNDVSNYIATQASVPVNVPVPAGMVPYTLPRIKLPNY